MEEEKKKVLEIALSQIEKNFGKGAIMRLGDSKARRRLKTQEVFWALPTHRNSC